MFWKVALSKRISYTEAERMDVDEIREACFALDYYGELLNEEIEKAKNK